MADRIVRDELLESTRWLDLPRNSHRLAFVCLLLDADTLGNLEAEDGHLWRLWRDPLGLDDRRAIAEILEALVAVDLIRIYPHEGKRYAHIPRFRQRLRYLGRIAPPSPWTTAPQIQLLAKNSPGDHQAVTGRSPDSHQAEVEVEVDVDVVRNQNLLVPAADGTKTPKPKTKTIGTRLPDDWRIPEDWIAIGMAVHPDWSRAGVIRESLSFRDYWTAKSGKDATKVRWLATWRLWIRRANTEPVR